MTQTKAAVNPSLRAVAGLFAIGLLSACTSLHHDLVPTEMIASPTGCADFSVSIYFDRGSTRLNREAGVLLEEASRRAHNCRIIGVSVTGLADRPGTPEANEALSKARSMEVTHALTRLGFSDFQFTPADGGAGAQTTVAIASPFRRRAEVQFHLLPLP